MSDMVCQTRCEAVIREEERMDNMERWQHAQNGSIKRVEAKVDKIIFLAVAELFAVVLLLVELIAKQ